MLDYPILFAPSSKTSSGEAVQILQTNSKHFSKCYRKTITVKFFEPIHMLSRKEI